MSLKKDFRITSLFLMVLSAVQFVFVSISAATTNDVVPIVTADFEDQSFKQGWTVQAVQGHTYWVQTTYNGNSYMQISGYKATGPDIESFLISPAIDFNAYDNETLTFKSKNGYYSGTTLSVWLSTDYDGSNVESATWQPLNAQIDERNNYSGYGATFIESGLVDLSAFSGMGHIAFKYSGNTSNRTTTYQVDDVMVTGSKKNFSGTLTSGLINKQINFPYVALGQQSEVYAYTLSYTGVAGDIKITCKRDYRLSLDGANWINELIVDTGTGDGSAEVKIKYAPQQEYYYGIESVVEHRVNNAMPYQIKVKPANAGVPIDATTLTKDKTLDVVTWNLQFFGIAPNGSSNHAAFETKLSQVANKIIELDADVYAIQEVIVDENYGDFLTPLIEKLNELEGQTSYAGVLAPRYSFYFQPPASDFPAQRICFIYNIKTVSNMDSFSMFSDFYKGYSTPQITGYPGNSSLFWASGRLPQMMKSVVQIDGKSQLLNFINLHAKCCDADERRWADAEYLFNDLILNYNDDNVVILGDYNETYSMSKGAYAPWYANWNRDYLRAVGSSLDHVSISDELYFEYQSLINNSRIDQVNYSDHDPVMLRMLIDTDKEPQSVTLAPIASQQVDNIIHLQGAASSGLPVTYKLVSGNASLSGDMLQVNGLGEVNVQAFQEGNAQYAPAFSDWVSFNIEGNTGVEQDYAQGLRVYPNPASHRVMVLMPNEGPKQIRIFDLTGKTHHQRIVFGKEEMLKTDDLPNGVYFIQITSGNITIAKKLVVKNR
ncbi:Por secretion system C-terminal sorting domain-containing protein [Saccharicrinis carchari]|uniref:Por secretion system C-terminal sorting domain-containing protein n=1 Tax=Saccharicrinis carchari TaxID=1168039 RepID=A0A521D341_SACCC|nr:T9SS type A sorting domain-containing protein [Saccharicrinis carchari]SMO65451.1 Por secretion system C-terminal sorting domain-containing protein [Saccharicrinis carchari]